MSHGGDIYTNNVDLDFSVSLNPVKRNPEEETLLEDAINRGIREACNYPDITQRTVRHAIAAAEGSDPENILAGAGASQLIMAVTTMVSPKKALIIEPAYSGYRYALSSIDDCEIISYVLREDKEFKPGTDLLDIITDDIDMIFVQDPINPTGQNLEKSTFYRILELANTRYITVLYDRSFYKISDGYGENRAGIFDKNMENYPNLFIIGSYTKSFALPGIRTGFAMSTKNNISKLSTYIPEWNISSIASSVMEACASIEQKGEYLRRSQSVIRKERQYLSSELSDMGFKVIKSDTVFILFKDEKGLDLYDELLKRRILIRKCEDFTGLGRGYYRIGVRSHTDNEILVNGIREIINGNTNC